MRTLRIEASDQVMQEGPRNYRAATITFIGGVTLLACSVQYFLTGNPGPWTPYPLATWVPLVMMAQVGFAFSLAVSLSAVVPMALFWILGLGLFRGRISIPRLSWIALFVLGSLQAIHLVYAWDYGIKYQGLSYTVTVSLLSAGVVAVTAVLLLVARKQQSFALTFSGHWLLCFWLGWFAFPYLGESL